MRKKALSFLTILVIISSCIFTGCKKDNSEVVENDIAQQERTEETADTGNEIPDDPDTADTEVDSYIDEV